MFKNNLNKGQAILIVILILVVVLTVSLSVASRIVTNLKTTGDQVSSQKAISTAQAGIEKVIKQIEADPSFTADGATYTISEGAEATVATQNIGGSNTVELGQIEKDRSVTLVLGDYDNSSKRWNNGITYENFTVSWGNFNNGSSDAEKCTNNAAVEVSIIYLSTPGDLNSARLMRKVFDGSCRSGDNRFEQSDPASHTLSTGGNTYLYEENIGTISNALLAKINVYYNGSPVGLTTSTPTLPVFGHRITSRSTMAGTTRSIEVTQMNDGISDGIFPFILYAP
jgi:Tfp pilus assembly protein PilX